ncbi:replication factor C subunit 1 isoform X2 [Nylanderia fulva]|uniref:replication factor C subunit 1 isoform X2 n=1 Tax=Nylanderia fulva TaxID=613905 RepID=UPI0010FB34DC|nr:replication factor C subunit 1 isoform X2 [Nylanderia fulva]
MPRDIRSYFTSIASSQKKKSEPVAPKSQKRRVISSDEDEEKSKSSIKRSKIVQKKPTKVSVLSDSDDDIVEIKKDFAKTAASKKNESEKPREAISTNELFGKRPVTRVEETKVKQKLLKLESEFHNDDDFDAVLKQLDTSQNMIIQDIKKDKVNTENVNISKNSEATIKTVSNESKKHDLKDNGTSKNSTKTKEMKKSPSKNNVHTKIITSPSKEKLKLKKNISTEDLSTNNKCSDDKSKKLNWNNLEINISKPISAVKENENLKKQSPGKRKTKTDNLFEERIEKKKQRSAMYEKYLQRGGARNPGSKEIPIGAQNCLAGLSFLLTGVFDSLERNEAEDLIQKYGGRTVNSVSGKVSYIVVGDEAGPSKLAKANSLGIKQISEDDLLEMIRTRPEGKAEAVKPLITKAKSKKLLNKFEEDKSPSSNKAKSAPTGSYELSEKVKTPPCALMKTSPSIPKQTSNVSSCSQETTSSISSQPLVEKYRPKTMKQIIGQQGDKSCAHNLYVWLRDWDKNRQDPKFKNSSSKQTQGQSFKAALLSGPPGVGKTTTVHVVCKELGYDIIEFNASDTRNKTLLKEAVSGLLSNTTMKDYVTGSKQKITNKHVLLMDEVDGMAGNEDRGGLQELLGLIKNTDVPIICICNDRFNTKVKSISTHSYDLRYHKLRVEQIRSSMKSLCFKENIKISTEDLDRLIESTNHDIRQVINHLEFLSGQAPHIEASDKKHSNKNFKLSPFDVAKAAFNAEEQKNMSLNDKIGLYFHDYNIAPLFIQENYLSVRSQVPLVQRLDKIAEAADNISQGDLVEKAMRSNMMWSLLPLHACFSFVIPANEMSGSLDGLVRFPSWFGRNSKTTRFNRLMQELTTHTRLATGANKDALNMDYMVHIRNAITKPLIDNGVDGIDAAINVMGKYHLTREDLDSIIEISVWPGIRDPTSNLESKVKAAFTRAYQKNPPMLPYVINSNATAKKRSMQDDDLIEEENDEEEDDSIEFDKMIKTKKSNTASTSKASTSKASTSTKRNGEPAKKRGKGRDKK